jgi:hypothetical protein
MNILKVGIMVDDYSTPSKTGWGFYGLRKNHEVCINLDTLWSYNEHSDERYTHITYSDHTSFVIDVPFKTFDALMRSNNSKLAQLFYLEKEQ